MIINNNNNNNNNNKCLASFVQGIFLKHLFAFLC